MINIRTIELSHSVLSRTQKYFSFFAVAAIANMKKGTTFATLFRNENKFLLMVR